MAEGEKVGSIFVGLDLDSKDFNASLGTAKEKVSSFGSIVNKEFSGVALAMAAGNVAASAVISTIEKLTSMVSGLTKESIMLGARVETLGVVLNVVGENAGYSAGETKKYVEEVKKMGITTQAAQDAIIKLASSQIKLSDASKLARVAQDAAVIGNINSSEAFQRMINGIRSGEVEILKTMGINVKFEAAYAKMAGSLKKTTEQLTEKEKAQARANAVIEYGILIEGAYEAAMGTAGKTMLSLSRFTEELKLGLGELFGPALTYAVNNITAALKSLNKEMDVKKSIGEWGDLTSLISDIGIKAWASIENSVKAVYYALKPIGEILLNLLPVFSFLADSFAKLTGYVAAFVKMVASGVSALYKIPVMVGTTLAMVAQAVTFRTDAMKDSLNILINQGGEFTDSVKEMAEGGKDLIDVNEKMRDKEEQLRIARKIANNEQLTAEEEKSKIRAKAKAELVERIQEEQKLLAATPQLLMQKYEAELSILKEENKEYIDMLRSRLPLIEAKLREQGESELAIAKEMRRRENAINKEERKRGFAEDYQESQKRLAIEAEKFNVTEFWRKQNFIRESQERSKANSANIKFEQSGIRMRKELLENTAAYYKELNAFSMEYQYAEIEALRIKEMKYKSILDDRFDREKWYAAQTAKIMSEAEKGYLTAYKDLLTGNTEYADKSYMIEKALIVNKAEALRQSLEKQLGVELSYRLRGLYITNAFNELDKANETNKWNYLKSLYSSIPTANEERLNIELAQNKMFFDNLKKSWSNLDSSLTKGIDIDSIIEKSKEWKDELAKISNELAKTKNVQDALNYSSSAEQMLGNWEQYYILQKKITEQKYIQIRLQATQEGKTKEQLDAINRLEDLEIRRAEERKTMLGSLKQGFSDTITAQGDMNRAMLEAGSQAAKDLAQTFEDNYFGMMTGKFRTLGEIFQSFLNIMLRGVAKILAAKTMSGAGDFLGMFGLSLSKDAIKDIGYHSGGYVSGSHNSLAGDEVPAILQKGEYVVSRKGVAALNNINNGNVSGVGGDVYVNIENKTGMEVKQTSTSNIWNGKQYVKNIMLELANTDMTIKRQYRTA
jgi:hypothetical protein